MALMAKAGGNFGVPDSVPFLKVDIPTGMYPATLITVEEGTRANMDDKSKSEPAWFWTFEVEGKRSNVAMNVGTSRSFNPGKVGTQSKAHAFATALLGEVGEEVDLESLQGLKCMVIVESKVSGSGSRYATIRELMPAQATDEEFGF